MLFLALGKAFEVVDRKILLNKLQWYRIKMLNWFKSYLENKTQRVKLNGLLSIVINMELGVSQESVMGPLLFLLHINDTTEIINSKCMNKVFADDAIIYTTGYSSKEINDQLNKQMLKVEKW